MTEGMAPQLQPIQFPLTGTRLIEASAGTGKTFTLAALYVRLVLGHGGATAGPPAGQPLLPTDILVVTFTRAATAELRDRIRRRLVAVARVFRGDDTAPDPVSQALVADYDPATHEACAARLELAAEWMDEAAVFTIHGWCQRMLSEHAFAAGSRFRQEFLHDEQDLLLAAAQDYWRRYLYPLQDSRLLPVLGRLAQAPEDLLQVIRPWLQPTAQATALEVGGEPLPPPLAPGTAAGELEQWQARLDRELASLQRVDLAAAYQEVLTAYEQGQLNGNKFRAKTWAEQDQPLWEAILADLSALDVSQPSHRQWVNKFSQHYLAGAVKKNQGPGPEHRAFAVLQDIQDVLSEEPVLWPAVAHHAGRWLAAEIQARKAQQGQLTFNDLLSQLHQALTAPGGEALAQRMRAQFPVALVDEFQDTDPMQWAILRAIYPAVDRTDTSLVLVGDPKQAIYSFRGADLHTYLSARRVTQGRHYNLPRNFRSTEPLITQVNALFEQAETEPGAAFDMPAGDTEPLPFWPVTAAGQTQQLWVDGQPAAGVFYWHEQTASPDCKKSLYEAVMARACARQIAALLQGAATGQTGFGDETVTDPVQAGDIAVLVRTGQQAELVRQELRRLELGSVFLSERDSVYAGPEAQAVLAWLQAVQSPEDENRVRGALLLPVCQISDAEFADWQADEQRWEDILEQLRVFRQQWVQQGVLPMLRAWLHYFNLPERWLAQTGSGERTLTNVLHLAELLQQESQFREGATGLIRWFSQQLIRPEQNDEQIMRLESDANLIKVVTIHKSKGLQYPLVFLPFATTFRPLERNRQVAYHRGEQPVLDLAIDGPALNQADRERRQEDIRLLYVALTRAVHAVWLGVSAYTSGRAKDSAISGSGLGQLLGLPAKCQQDDLALALRSLPWQQAPLPGQDVRVPTGTAPDWQPAARPAARVQRRRWWIASYSALQASGSKAWSSPDTPREAQGQDDDEPAALLTPTPGTMHALPRGAAVGTFLHGLLEWCCEHGFAHVQQHPEVLERLLAQRLPLRGWQEHHAVLADWLHQMLTVPVRGSDVSLAALPQTVAEMEFWLGSRAVSVARLDDIIQRYVWPGVERPPLLDEQVNGMLKGFIDLTHRAPDGRYWVLDFKSNWLGPHEDSYQEQAMQRAILEKRYDVQASLYLFALHRLLLAREPGYRQQPEAYLGGAHYWFVRAPHAGQCVLTPEPALLFELDTLFRGTEPLHAQEQSHD